MTQKLPVRAVLFDLDGTLVDTAGDLAAAVNIVLAKSGHPQLPLAAVRGMIGAGIRALAERAWAASGRPLAEDELDAREAELLAIYSANPAEHSRLMPGAAVAVQWCREHQLPMAVVTNKPEEVSRTILDCLGLAAAFNIVIGGDSGLPRKPAPDMLLAAASANGAKAAEAIMIGDSAADVAAARAAKMAVIVVSGGYTDVAAEALNADLALPSLTQLPDAILAWPSGL